MNKEDYIISQVIAVFDGRKLNATKQSLLDTILYDKFLWFTYKGKTNKLKDKLIEEEWNKNRPYLTEQSKNLIVNLYYFFKNTQ